MPANQPNIPPYTAADLLRYATGGMSAPEMHRLEKAALEDPFLAEALEGYLEAAATHPQAVLQQQLDQLPPADRKKQETKVIPLWRRKAVQLAAAAVMVSGSGWWLLSLLNSDRKEETATASRRIESAPVADSIAPAMLATDSTIAYQPPLIDTLVQSPAFAQVEQQSVANEPGAMEVQQQKGADTTERQETAVSTAAEADMAYNRSLPANPFVRMSSSRMDSAAASQEIPAAAQKEVVSDNMEKAFKKSAPTPVYTFKGTLTDAQNNPLPYASVMTTDKNTGTYTDAQGHFHLIAADSTLKIKTRSVGYEPQILTLSASRQNTRIVMQEDEQQKVRIPANVSARKPRVYDFRTTIIEQDSLQGAVQPRIGFTNYNLYLANNNRLSGMEQQGRQVQLHFEVDKDGNATNVTVVQSSGKRLDEEAIRLLKEGPKWKPSIGKKGKITVKF